MNKREKQLRCYNQKKAIQNLDKFSIIIYNIIFHAENNWRILLFFLKGLSYGNVHKCEIFMVATMSHQIAAQ